MKKIVLVFFLFLTFQIFPVSASESIEQVTYQETEEVVTEKRMNFFEELHYRIIYKDTKDFFDYVILGTAIVALLIVMVFQNTHYVIVTRPLEETIFQDEKSTYTVEEVVEEVKEEKKKDELETKDEDQNPEILSSDLLEEEIDVKPVKKERNNKKKRA